MEVGHHHRRQVFGERGPLCASGPHVAVPLDRELVVGSHGRKLGEHHAPKGRLGQAPLPLGARKDGVFTLQSHAVRDQRASPADEGLSIDLGKVQAGKGGGHGVAFFGIVGGEQQPRDIALQETPRGVEVEAAAGLEAVPKPGQVGAITAGIGEEDQPVGHRPNPERTVSPPEPIGPGERFGRQGEQPGPVPGRRSGVGLEVALHGRHRRRDGVDHATYLGVSRNGITEKRARLEERRAGFCGEGTEVDARGGRGRRDRRRRRDSRGRSAAGGWGWGRASRNGTGRRGPRHGLFLPFELRGHLGGHEGSELRAERQVRVPGCPRAFRIEAAVATPVLRLLSCVRGGPVPAVQATSSFQPEGPPATRAGQSQATIQGDQGELDTPKGYTTPRRGRRTMRRATPGPPLRAAPRCRSLQSAAVVPILAAVPDPLDFAAELKNGPVPHKVRLVGEGMELLPYVLDTFPAVARPELVAAVHEGRFRTIEGEVLGPSTTLRRGQTLLADVLAAVPEDPWALPLPSRLTELFRDRALLAIDKPPSLLCYPLGPRRVAALSLAERQLAADGENPELRPLHRLDAQTSGVLLFAREIEADRRIKRAFERRLVQKSYIALVRGRFPDGEHAVDSPIGPDDGGPIRMRMRVRSDGQAATTVLRSLGGFGDRRWPDGSMGCSWVQARPLTGRTHQIRVHLASVGHPIVGDRMYLDGGEGFLAFWDHRLDEALLARVGHRRQALHAEQCRLDHPLDGTPLLLRAPVPEDLLRLAEAEGGGPPGSTADLEGPR